MRSLRISALFIIVFVLFIGVVACGNNDSDASEQQTNAVQSAEQTTVQTSEKNAEPVVETVEQSLPTVDSKASADELIGSWKGIDADDQFVNITKTETGYQYEDNDGIYPATFENSALKVKATDTDTADVYIDPQTGHLITAYQGGISEYEKK